MSGRKFMRYVIVCFALATASHALGEVTNYRIADVTSSSFTVVFASTVAAVAPDIKLFQDDQGLIELSRPFQVISDVPHHENGLVAIRVNSLSNDTTYHVRFTDDSGSGVYFPGASLVAVTTFSLPPTNGNDLISNDLIKLDIYKPNQITSLQGAIVLLSMPTVNPYPVSAFVSINEFAYIDANNLIKGDAAMHLLQAGNNIEVNVFRGLLCAGAVDQLQVFYRKYGDDLDAGTQVVASNRCAAPDTVCDDQINVLDVQFVLNSLNASPDDCNFTEELDVVRDQAINVLDVQQILNYF